MMGRADSSIASDTSHGTDADLMVGTILSTRQRLTTPREAWVDLLTNSVERIALADLLLIDGPGQQILGSVVDLQFVEDSMAPGDTAPLGRHGRVRGHGSRRAYAKLTLFASSDGRQQRLPQGTRVRYPTPAEVTELLTHASAIPAHARIPVCVVATQLGYAPMYLHLERLVGPHATSILITGAAGTLKSTGGLLLLTSMQHQTQEKIAAIVINSKGSDYLFADCARDQWAPRLQLAPLSEQDYAMYRALDFPNPPTLKPMTAFVPDAHDPAWRSPRPVDFPRTRSYRLSYMTGVRYALAPSEEDQRPTSIITRQCIEEIVGPFADEAGITSLGQLTDRVEEIFIEMGERSRWRNQFQSSSVSAALRQLRAAARDLGPLLGLAHEEIVSFPIEELAQGGAWVIDVARLPRRAAQAVIDEVISTVWKAKADGTLPHDLPTVLLIDELNAFSTTGPTATRLASIVRDQRHRRFGLIGLAQQLSTLHPQLLANADTTWFGLTRSSELNEEVYAYLPLHVRAQLTRLPQGARMLESPIYPEPLLGLIPFPSWLISDEGLQVVRCWEERRQLHQEQASTASA